MKLVFALLAFAALHAHAEQEACDAASQTASSSSLLQVHKAPSAVAVVSGEAVLKSSKTCSYSLVADQDGSQVCEHLSSREYISGAFAAFDETGYQQTAKLCCHHEMSLFVRREIARQGFDVCDLSDLHGFVHWYDCTNDLKTYAGMKNELAGVMT